MKTVHALIVLLRGGIKLTIEESLQLIKVHSAVKAM